MARAGVVRAWGLGGLGAWSLGIREVIVASLLIAYAATVTAQTTPVPPPTDDDRKAAFPPDLQGHAVHDTGLHFMVLGDQLEWQVSGLGVGALWDTKAWVGGDLNRIWIRSEADYQDGGFDDAEAHLMLGRNISRWWAACGRTSRLALAARGLRSACRVWHRKLFGTGDLAREHGEDVGGWRFVSGFRVWF